MMQLAHAAPLYAVHISTPSPTALIDTALIDTPLIDTRTDDAARLTGDGKL